MTSNDSKEHIETLSEIRNLMERSSRFISLSGLSGIMAGIFALLGAAAGYYYLNIELFAGDRYYEDAVNYRGNLNSSFLKFFILDALIVLIASIGFGIFFTTRKAKKHGLKTWDNTAKRMLINLLIPLFAGGVFCFILLHHRIVALIAPVTLIFYGLALLNASKYTLNDVRYLGLSEIGLGLLASYFVDHGLLFWSIGFGVLHIIYGSLMYFKYERK